MAEKKYKRRVVDQLLAERLEEVGAVLIEGPKWCGKTTTAEQFAKSKLKFIVVKKEWNVSSGSDTPNQVTVELLKGEKVILPIFNFLTGEKEFTEEEKKYIKEHGC